MSDESEFSRMLRQARELAEAEEEGRMSTDLSTVFCEEPVSLPCFVQDSKFLGNPPLSPVQYEAVRHIERVYYPELYPLMAEFDGKKKMGTLHVGPVSTWRDDPYWSTPYRMTNFITLQWGKGSSSPNVPIYNARTGQWVRLRDWDVQDQVASAYPQDGKVFAATGTAAFKEGDGRMLRVRTRKGHEIDVWEGHRFLSWARRTWPSGQRVAQWQEAAGPAWTRLWDLRVGDPIAIATTVPEPTQCLTGVPDRDVELVGLWLGDGCMKSGNSIVCGTDAPATRARAKALFEQFPHTWVKEVLDESGGSRRWKVYPKAEGSDRYLSGPVNVAALHYGIARKTALHKAVPEEFCSLDNRQSALLLSRLIDTDGWLATSNTAEIGYGTVSHQLAVDVQRLMLRLGAVAELKRKTGTCQNCEHGERHESFQVRVRDRRSVLALAEQLTLLDKEPNRLAMLDWLEARTDRKQRAVHGDLMWDKIASIEELGEGEYWTLSVDGPASYISSNGILDHNSGKDHVARVACMRIAYLLLCLHSPQTYFGMPEQDTIHLLNVASNSHQARDAFFTPMTKAVKHGWFKDRADPKQNVIDYDKNIASVSGHSDAESQEGLNLLLAVADEIDAFKSKKEVQQRRGGSGRAPTKSAEGILEMMRTSGITRFARTFKNVRISFPRYMGSMIQHLTHEAKEDVKRRKGNSRHYVSGPLPTWEVNPRVTGPEAFAHDYNDDPVMARAKYECKPARAINPYFRNVVAVDSVFKEVEQYPVEVGYAVEESLTDRRVWVPKYVFAPDFFPVRGANYAMHGDLALTGDRAGIAMAHVVDYTEHETFAVDEDGATHTIREVRPKVKVDFVINFTADSSADPPREIQIRWARQLAFELIRRGFNVRRFSFDIFQSADSMQILQARGIDCEKVSADQSEDPYRTLRDLMYEGRLVIPRPPTEPDKSFLLRDELFGLTRMPNGKIDHAPGESKDEADALACACYGAILIGGREEEGGSRAVYSAPDFVVGSAFELPFGASLHRIWEREFPSPF